VHRLGVGAFWRRQPRVVRRALPALPIAGALLVLARTGVLRRSPEVYILVAAVLAIFLARSAYAGFWVGLEGGSARRFCCGRCRRS
jgi:hypothetical protein